MTAPITFHPECTNRAFIDEAWEMGSTAEHDAVNPFLADSVVHEAWEMAHNPRFTDFDTPVQRGAWTIRASIKHDDAAGAPWDNEDGHGPVSEWRSSYSGHPVTKKPGELVLAHDSGSYRLYDFAEACRIARRDGWGCSDGRRAGETGKAYAARAAIEDFERLRAWCNDEWCYVGVVVTVESNGHTIGTASCWCIESDADAYLLEVANELIDEALETVS